MKRRKFVQSTSAGLLGTSYGISSVLTSFEKQDTSTKDLDRIIAEPILDQTLFKDPLIIDKIELLRLDNSFLCRISTADGAQGISSSNAQMQYLYPIFKKRIEPFLLGKDARDWEEILDQIYVYKSNYKLQNLALWVPLATVEFAILDLLGNVCNRSIGQLLGVIHHPYIAIYQANNFRGKTAEESIELIKSQVERSGAKAIKFKVGGRMSKNLDSPPGRSEKLIPLVRKTFGDDMTIYADSNGSYDVNEAIRIGKIMEAHRYDFYEEPVPFDWYEETKTVTQSLDVPIAGGEQEPSMHNFRWLIHHRALDIVQPDIFYFGGMIRSLKVARMAAARGLICTPHISGSDLGYLYMMHFVSAVPNAGPFHEFKGFNRKLKFTCSTSSMTSEYGSIKVPSGAGLGIEIDQDYLSKYKPVIL